MPLLPEIEPVSRRLGALRPPAVARDFAVLFGAAAAIGVAASLGLMLAVIGLV